MTTLESHWAPHLRPNGTEKDPISLSTNIASPTTTSTQTQTPASPLLALPRELRNEIYTHLLPARLSFTMKNQTRHNDSYIGGAVKRTYFPLNYYLSTHPLLLTSHLLRHEFLDSIYTTTRFTFCWRRRAKFILACLEAVPEAAKSRIRHLAWEEWGLHTGRDARGYKGWVAVMKHISTHFTSLRSIRWSFPSGEDGGHRYHNWEVPRFAAQMLADGRVERLEWGYGQRSIGYHSTWYVEGAQFMAERFLSIPYVEGVDGDMGWEFRRLLKEEWELRGSDHPLDRWALECKRRPRHWFDVRVDVGSETLVLTRRRGSQRC